MPSAPAIDNNLPEPLKECGASSSLILRVLDANHDLSSERVYWRLDLARSKAAREF